MNNAFVTGTVTVAYVIPYAFRVRRLVPLITDIYVFDIIYIRISVPVRRTCVLIYAYKQKIVAVGVFAFSDVAGMVIIDIGFEFVSISVRKSSGRRYLTVNKLGKRACSVYTCTADDKACVDTFNSIEKTKLHRIGGVDYNDNVFIRASHIVKQFFFFRADFEIGTRRIGCRIIFILYARRIFRLARTPAYNDKRGIGKIFRSAFER